MRIQVRHFVTDDFCDVSRRGGRADHQETRMPRPCVIRIKQLRKWSCVKARAKIVNDADDLAPMRLMVALAREWTRAHRDTTTDWIFTRKIFFRERLIDDHKA